MYVIHSLVNILRFSQSNARSSCQLHPLAPRQVHQVQIPSGRGAIVNVQTMHLYANTERIKIIEQ
jgi:hypothetical protein